MVASDSNANAAFRSLQLAWLSCSLFTLVVGLIILGLAFVLAQELKGRRSKIGIYFLAVMGLIDSKH